MLWTVFAVLIVLWIIGFAMEIGGGLIHILLVLALLAIVFNLFAGRRRV